MGGISSRNKSLLITLLIAAIFVSSILTSVTRSLDENKSLSKNSDASDGNDWSESDADGDGIVNVNDTCPFWHDESCSVLLSGNNSLYSKILGGFIFENETIVDFEYSPNGQYIAIASRWYGVTVVNSISYEVEKYFPLSSYYSDIGYMSRTESVAFSNDGSILAIFGSGGLLEVSTGDWSISSADLADQYESHFGGADIVFSPDDSQIAIAANYNITVGDARIWDRFDGWTVSKFRIESNGMFYEKVAAIDYSKDGDYLALAQGNQFAIYGTTNWDLVTSFTNDNTSKDCENYHRCSNYAKDLEFSNNGLYLAVSHFNSSIEVYSTNIVCQNCSSWELLPEKSNYVDEKFELEGITFSPDSTSIISLWAGEDYLCCGKIKIFNIHNNTLISFEINGEGILWDVAISPDGNSIAFGDNDAYMEYDADWEELPDGTGLFTIELDSDSDGVRDSIDDCDSEQGGVVNDTRCEEITESPASSVDNGISETFEFIVCGLALFSIGFVAWTLIRYYVSNKSFWVLICIILGIALVLSINSLYPGGVLKEAASSNSHGYECPDGTIVTYGESLELRDYDTTDTMGKFLESPPEHWCDGSIEWLGEYADQGENIMYSYVFIVLFAVCLMFLTIDYKLGITFTPVSLSQNISSSTASASFPASVVSSSPVVNPSRAKKDLLKHLEVGGWISHVDDDGTEWWEDSDETWWYRQQGDGDWEQWIDGNTPKEKNSSKQSKPTLVSQASSKPMARESASAKQNLSHKLPAAKVIRMEDFGLKGEGNEIIVPSASQPMDLNTNVLANNSYSEPQEKKSKITTDSSGITTIETGFSVVTLNKLTDEVTKVPIGTEQHEMFYQEIKNMEYLDGKGFDVGLIGYDDGSNPKIVTRYMGPSKLSEQFQTLSNRGKKNLIIDLINQVAQIHKCGMVHRDLKPDNILIDARPRDGNHQLDAIIDFGIAMKINRKQTDSHNTAATKFFGHSSQKDVNFNASTGQDWFSLARIFALILRGASIDSLNAEIQMSQTGLDVRNEIQALGFNDKVVDSMTELIIQSTKSSCEQHETVGVLARIGKEIAKSL